MRLTRSIMFFAGSALLAACGDSTAVAAPSVAELWLGPDVIADAAELSELAETAVDPVMEEVSLELPDDSEDAVWSALHEFELGLKSDPGPAFVALEKSLLTVDDDPRVTEDPDMDLANGVLKLYRDWASQALFGMDRADLGDVSKWTGS